jgi:hypothetical protein
MTFFRPGITAWICAIVIGIPSESLNFSFDCVAAPLELARNVNLKLSKLRLLE